MNGVTTAYAIQKIADLTEALEEETRRRIAAEDALDEMVEDHREREISVMDQELALRAQTQRWWAGLRVIDGGRECGQ